MLTFEIKPFRELSGREVYDILVLRSEVFVVEQQCVYLDPDGLDIAATHILGREHAFLVAYARWYDEEDHVRLGRIVTHPRSRGRGHGRRLMEACLEHIGPEPILVHGQLHLRRFYERFGFQPVGHPFEEDGIPHQAMLRRPG